MTNRRTLIAGLLGGFAARTSLGDVKLARAQVMSGDALQWLPALLPDPARWPTRILTFADIAGYCATTGIERPGAFTSALADTWMEISRRIPIDDGTLFRYADIPWSDLIGFSVGQIEHVAVGFDPPRQLRFYSGHFDPGQIELRLLDADYAARKVGNFIVLDSATDEIDIKRDLDRYTLGGFKHIAASDRMVVATKVADDLDATLDVLGGEVDAFADAPELSAVSDIAATFTGYLLLNGTTLGRDRMAAAPAPDDEIPPARLLLAGIRANDRHGVSLIADLVEPDAAESAVPIIEARIKREVSPVSGIPYAELLAGHSVDVLPGTGLVRIAVSNEEIETRWMRMIYTLDLAFLATT